MRGLINHKVIDSLRFFNHPAYRTFSGENEVQGAGEEQREQGQNIQ